MPLQFTLCVLRGLCVRHSFLQTLEFHEHHHYSFNHDGFTDTAGSSDAEADTAAQ